MKTYNQNICRLCQCQFPGFHTVLYLSKLLPLGEFGVRDSVLLFNFLWVYNYSVFFNKQNMKKKVKKGLLHTHY